jgi:hypothetical protein
MMYLLPEVFEDLFAVDGHDLGEVDEHGAEVLRHTHQPGLLPPEQHVQTVIEDQLADAVDHPPHDKVLLECEEAWVDVVILAERGNGRDGGEHGLLVAKAVEDAVSFGGAGDDGGGADAGHRVYGVPITR